MILVLSCSRVRAAGCLAPQAGAAYAIPDRPNAVERFIAHRTPQLANARESQHSRSCSDAHDENKRHTRILAGHVQRCCRIIGGEGRTWEDSAPGRLACSSVSRYSNPTHACSPYQERRAHGQRRRRVIIVAEQILDVKGHRSRAGIDARYVDTDCMTFRPSNIMNPSQIGRCAGPSASHPSLPRYPFREMPCAAQIV